MDLYELKQYNNILNSNLRCLDLVLENVHTNISRSIPRILKVDRHHPALSLLVTLIDIGSTICNLSPHFPLFNYNFKKCDYSKLYVALLNIDWPPVYKGPHTAYACLYDTFYTILDKYVPRYSKFSYPKFPCWYTKNIIQDHSLNLRLYKKYNKYMKRIFYENIKSLERILINK